MRPTKHNRQASLSERAVTSSQRQSLISARSLQTCPQSTKNRRIISLDFGQQRKKDKNFNRYYIPPSLRYRQKAINPKDTPENYIDESFVYNNLHNHAFWNWAHPLEQYAVRPPSNGHLAQRSLHADKIDLPVLQKFKQYVERRSKRRVPLVVRELLSSSRQAQ